MVTDNHVATTGIESNPQRAAHLDAHVSMFRNCKATKPHAHKSMADVLHMIQTGSMAGSNDDRGLAERVERLRSITNETAAKVYKTDELPAITACGAFTYRAKDGIKQPSDFVAIDFDGLASTEAAAVLRDQLRDDPHVISAFISPGGKGVKAIVQTDGLVDDAAMKRLFPLLQSRYGAFHPIDESTSDVSRLCILSYDPGLWINEGAQPLVVPDATAQVDDGDDVPALRLITPASGGAHGIAYNDSATIHAIAIMRKAEREKDVDPSVSRHKAMLNAQMVAKGYIAQGLCDAEAIHDALRDEYARMHGGDAERLNAFDRGWHGAQPVPITAPDVTQDVTQSQPTGAMKRDRMGRMITPAEIVIHSERMPDDRYQQMLAAALIDTTAKIERPPSLFTFDGHPLLTAQNISVISGKAKSRKSGWASVLAALTINPNTSRDWIKTRAQRLQAHRDGSRRGVMLFDTEQSNYHAQAMARRILWMADRESNPDMMLRAFGLRDFTPIDRLQFIAETIHRHADECSLIIIDGVRDVVMNINSEDEASLMNTWLLSITKRYNIHLSCVLHENKGTDTLRGHLGTELMNKSEAVFTVAKGTHKATRDLSSVETTVSRNKGMERIGIESVEMERDGVMMWIPSLVDDGRADSIGKATEGSTAETSQITDAEHAAMIGAIWNDNPAADVPAGDLRDAVRAIGKQITGRHISQAAAKDIIADWLNVRRWIVTNGKPTVGRCYRLSDPEPSETPGADAVDMTHQMGFGNAF